MKINSMLVLHATCSIILIAATYATSTELAKQRQAEVNLQQASPSSPRPLKFGDKTTIKIPQKEIFLPTPLPTNRNNENVAAPLKERQQIRSRDSHNGRMEYITLPTENPKPAIARRYDSGGGSPRNQLVVQQQQQHDIPIVHKNRELYNKPITPTVGQQHRQQQQQRQPQRQQSNSNRSRFSNANVPTQQHTNNEAPTIVKTTTVATVKKQNIRQQQQRKSSTTTTTRTLPSAINNSHLPLSSSSSPSPRNNANHNRTNNNYNSSINNVTTHHHSSNRNNNNSLALLSAAAAASQPKIVTSSNKQRSNIKVSQSVSSSSSSSSSSTSVRSSLRKSPTSTASTITPSSSTTTTTTSRPPFQLPSTFNIFTPEFWQFFYPPTSPAPRIATTTKKPPKKYKPPVSAKEEKLNYSKPKTPIPPRETKQPEQPKINEIPKRDDGPFRIALPTFNILSSRREATDESEKGKRDVEEDNLRNRFNCPRESEVRFQLFPKICQEDEDCKVWNRDEICCEIFGAKSCVSGIPKPLEETSHSPILGILPRKCPSRPLAELWWEVKECETDSDCWPRVCCPDGRRRYCRTSQPELNTVPVPVKRSFNYLSEYLECTAPPPPIFDLHPKTCTSTLDCFPNVCCQEAGLRHCRPPKKSVLTMLANVFNVDFVKRLTQNIVIK